MPRDEPNILDFAFPTPERHRKVMLAEQPDPFKGLAALAARLGVESKPEDSDVSVFITSDGGRYDLFELANAFLDRMDAIEAKTNE